MKFGIRKPSLNKRIAAQTSWKRVVRHSMGIKAPRGFGWFTNPKRAAYNRIYNRTTFKADNLIILAVVLVFTIIGSIISFLFRLSTRESASSLTHSGNNNCPYCGSSMILRNGKRGQFYGCLRFPRCRGTRDYTEPNQKLKENVT